MSENNTGDVGITADLQRWPPIGCARTLEACQEKLHAFLHGKHFRCLATATSEDVCIEKWTGGRVATGHSIEMYVEYTKNFDDVYMGEDEQQDFEWRYDFYFQLYGFFGQEGLDEEWDAAMDLAQTETREGVREFVERGKELGEMVTKLRAKMKSVEVSLEDLGEKLDEFDLDWRQ